MQQSKAKEYLNTVNSNLDEILALVSPYVASQTLEMVKNKMHWISFNAKELANSCEGCQSQNDTPSGSN